MDLKLSVFLLFILFTAGQCLRCYECLAQKDSCANQKAKTCPSGFSKCMSSTAVTNVGTLSAKVKAKDCVADCESGSMNIGMLQRSSVCCNTDQCNLPDAPDPSNVPNGKKCYYCDDKDCSKTVSCTRSEDRCITATAGYGEQSMVVKGCVSKSICDSTASFDQFKRISCCSGNLCNGAESVTRSINSAESVPQSFLFLCCSLLSFVLLH